MSTPTRRSEAEIVRAMQEKAHNMWFNFATSQEEGRRVRTSRARNQAACTQNVKRVAAPRDEDVQRDTDTILGVAAAIRSSQENISAWNDVEDMRCRDRQREFGNMQHVEA